MEIKLKTDFWVAAYIRRLTLQNIPVFVTRHGDNTAGAVLVKANKLDGTAVVYQRRPDTDTGRVWAVLAQGAEQEIDQAIQRQINFDPDIWVLEVEGKEGKTLLDEVGLNG